MLSREDKIWIENTIDERVDKKLDVRLAEFEERFEKKLDEKLDEKLERTKNQILMVMENSFERYMKVVNECLPESTRSYDRIEEVQYRHQGDINTLMSIAMDHGRRISDIEDAMS